MELVTVKAPKGSGEQMAKIAFEVGISKVDISSGFSLVKNQDQLEQDVFEFQSKTPNAKEFLERLMSADFYDPKTFNFTTMHPESIFAMERPEEETMPIVRPTTDVYQELWQFCEVTISLISRVFLSAFLLAYGMKEAFMPLIIAGLLFLPYHHHLIGMSLGAAIKEGRLFRQGLYAFLLSTLCIIAAGILVGFLSESPIKFEEFAKTPISIGFLISAAIGIAAGFGTIDDAGRRELIGLAATAHLAVYPAWFGMKFVFGFDASDKPLEFLMVFLMDVITITVFAGLTLKIMKMRGKGIRRFVRQKERSSP